MPVIKPHTYMLRETSASPKQHNLVIYHTVFVKPCVVWITSIITMH